MKKKAVAVTGAASGLGRELALGLALKGYKVFGTALSASDVLGFKSTAPAADITLTVCDITKEADVINWARIVTSVHNDGLDLLINNAGVLTPGPMEVLTLDDIRKEFEVNVFGSIAVINAFLPLLRKAKGRIVQIGSLTGRFPVPFSGPSSASKATVEALADVYRMELKPFGVDVVLAQPGSMLTGGPAKSAAQMERLAAGMNDEQRRLYGKTFTSFAAAFNKMQSEGLSAHDAANRVIEIAEQTPAPSRAHVGKDADEILQMVHDNTDEELDNFRRKLFDLDRA